MSALARSLRDQWMALDETPGHVEVLNMLARAAGFRNLQHFRAQAVARERLNAPPPTPVEAEPVNLVRVQRVMRVFDSRGRMTRWPPKHSERVLCLWGLWATLPSKQVLTERAVNDHLNARHLFGDHALLRRELCDHGLMTRTRDGREYRRVERRPPADALALIHAVSQLSVYRESDPASP